MLKRVISLLCLCAIFLSLVACGNTAEPTEPTPPPQTLPPGKVPYDPTAYKVTKPMAYPEYGFDKEPSNLTLRQEAVGAFKDLLSIRWSSPINLKYNKYSSLFFNDYRPTPYMHIL